ncbi:MAG: phage holin family protein [Actinomycetota bacterium]|nr:phage holin family protein [Actinomycetota bacterium]
MVAIAIKIAVNAVALWIATLIVPGIFLSGSGQTKVITLVVVALIFGVVNAVLKPLIKTVGCGLYLLTLGLVGLVVNALLFLLVGWLSGKVGLSFAVNGFWAAFWGAIVVSVIGLVLHLIIPDSLDER